MRKTITSILMICLILVGSLPISDVVAQPPEKIQVIVGFNGKPDAALIKSRGGDIKYEYTIIRAIASSLPQKAIDALMNNPKVAYIEEDGVVELVPGEDSEVLPWGVERIGADLVHPYNKGTGIRVAIIDTGIDYTHLDLYANYYGGYDYVNKDNDPMDDNGHGTHVAGIVSAEDNDIGVIGVAPEADLYAIKVLDSGGSGYLSDVVAGIDWSVNNGMQVISMSLGTSTYSESLQDACAAAYDNGIVVIAAAGNSGNPPGRGDNILYPARYSSVIAVGATDPNDKRARWSSTGSALELMAPGVEIYSTYPGDAYATLSGTSMAVPYITGTASLILFTDVDPAYDFNENGVWDAIEVRMKLRDTADDLGDPGWDSKYGYGLVDADEAAPGVDTIPPTISDLTPADGALINTATPTISATVTDASDIDAASIAMTLDGATVVHTYDGTTGQVSAEMSITLAEGIHTVTLSISDTVGNSATASWSFTVDTTPPAQITDVTVTVVSSSQLDVSWTANEELDLDHYNVYRSTMSGGSYDLVAKPTTNSYSDTGLTASTNYYYIVSAVDMAGNEGARSSEASGTTSEATALTMHVASIDLSTEIKGKSGSANLYITVKVVDSIGAGVEGATVQLELTWSSGKESFSGITGSTGEVTFKYSKARVGETYTATVTDVVKNDWIYDPSENVETSDKITI